MTALLNRFLDFFHRAQPRGEMYLVGGTVRDLLLHRETRDIDVSVTGDALAMARAFADSIGATYVLLDADFGIARVVQGDEYLDVCAIRGDTIYKDLADRDFTINAMALPLADHAPAFAEMTDEELAALLIDPFDGRKDSRFRTIRMISEQNLINDPLRILRAYRFTATHRFLIEITTLNALRKHGPLLSQVAVERVAEELHHLIESPHSYATIEAMNHDGILQVVLPELAVLEPDARHLQLQAYRHAEHVVSNLDLFFPDHADPFTAYCTKGLNLLAVKLCALFSAGNRTAETVERLRLGNKTADLVRFLGARPDAVAQATDEASRIDLLRYYEGHVHGLVILTLSRQRVCQVSANPLLAAARELIGFYHGVYAQRKSLLPLITGHDLKAHFGLAPSPLFRKLLDTVELMVLRGEISTREEALIVSRSVLAP
jgi:tRNA nucleotidyltransferase/poly(A) polymerase